MNRQHVIGIKPTRKGETRWNDTANNNTRPKRDIRVWQQHSRLSWRRCRTRGTQQVWCGMGKRRRTARPILRHPDNGRRSRNNTPICRQVHQFCKQTSRVHVHRYKDWLWHCRLYRRGDCPTVSKRHFANKHRSTQNICWCAWTNEVK